jgi:hypothetical protein
LPVSDGPLLQASGDVWFLFQPKFKTFEMEEQKEERKSDRPDRVTKLLEKKNYPKQWNTMPNPQQQSRGCSKMTQTFTF